MKIDEAQILVKDVFNNSFDESKLKKLIVQLFNIKLEDNKVISGKNIAEAFSDGIVAYKRLASYKDSNNDRIDVLVVELANQRKLENSRSLQRNFIARYLNNSDICDAALVAFYSKDSVDWRFSLVKLEYLIEPNVQKIRKELTPAKRFSFLVGLTEKTHTVCKQIIPLLTKTNSLEINDFVNAFNIEIVTDEFFDQYKELYLDLKKSLDMHIKADKITREEFDKQSIKSDEFSKRLLGQIVFLYFLQKKGWLGVEKSKSWGSGPKDFLLQLFKGKYTNYSNFFNDILEPLFYDALASERTNHFYQLFNCRIPFLNGGLFEPINNYDWVNTDILLDNKIFEKIFKVFDLYNFTVREDEPLDKEVAVDPEMLGKVFENLIPINEKKGSGVFYTHRDIVHYMCQESIINYLDSQLNLNVYNPHVSIDDIAEFVLRGDRAHEHDLTAQSKNKFEDYKGDYIYLISEDIRMNANVIDKALEDIKICDPAVGSGAFPVGIMTEIVRIRLALNPYLETDTNRTAYDFKRHAIEESLYGVDIDSSSVDIAKLRLWLSLVVDEIEFENIQPLPNLDYKIVVGNSLVGFPFESHGRTDKYRELSKLKAEFMNTFSHSKKMKLRSSINGLINQEYKNSHAKETLGYEVDFDFRWSFFEVFDLKNGFDIIIANPPYCESRSKEFPSELKDKYQNDLRVNWPNTYELVPRGSDLMIYFFPKSLMLLNDNGIACLITENSWLDTDYGFSCQKFMLNHSDFKAIIDSKFRYFSGKNAPNINTIISVFAKQNQYKESCLNLIHLDMNVSSVDISLASLNKNINPQISVKSLSYEDPKISSFKWGHIFRMPDWFCDVLKLLDNKITDESKLLSFGQGLNVTLDYAIPKTLVIELRINKNALLPFYVKTSSYAINDSDNYLVDVSKIDKSVQENLKNKGYKCIDLESTRKIPASLIMPRGIGGKHYSAMNNINSFSFSGAEIYLDKNVSEEEKLAVWAYTNSSLYYLLRELTGRTNLGGGLLKSETTDLSNFHIPFKALKSKIKEIRDIYSKFENAIPQDTLLEIETKNHLQLDEVVLNCLNLNQYKDKIIDLLKFQITYRFDKSIS